MLTEVKVRDWEDAEDAHIQEAMHKVDRFESKRMKVGTDFQDYKGMVEAWFVDQISQPGSEYSNLKTEVEDFYSECLEAIITTKEQDRDRNLGT